MHVVPGHFVDFIVVLAFALKRIESQHHLAHNSADRLVGRFDVVYLPIGERDRDRYVRAGLARLVPVFVCRP